MEMLSQEVLVNNFLNYRRFLDALIGKPLSNKLIENVGGEESLMRASFGMQDDSGTAFEGSLVMCSLEIAEYAKKINETFNFGISNASIYKVALLSHIAKALMYVKNTNEWEVQKRGFLYKFNNSLNGSMRCGERSVYIAMQADIKFTEEEFEAMRVVDKINEGDGEIRWYGTPLSMVIRQANEIVNILKRNGR